MHEGMDFTAKIGNLILQLATDRSTSKQQLLVMGIISLLGMVMDMKPYMDI
jgi:hypothetical protein